MGGRLGNEAAPMEDHRVVAAPHVERGEVCVKCNRKSRSLLSRTKMD